MNESEETQKPIRKDSTPLEPLLDPNLTPDLTETKPLSERMRGWERRLEEGMEVETDNLEKIYAIRFIINPAVNKNNALEKIRAHIAQKFHDLDSDYQPLCTVLGGENRLVSISFSSFFTHGDSKYTEEDKLKLARKARELCQQR